MNRIHLAACLALVPVIGCSGDDKNEAPSAVQPDAAPEAAPEVDSSSTADVSSVPVDLDACMRDKVWTMSSTGFTLHEDAGSPSAPSGDAGCSEGGVTFVFSLTAKTLTERKCKGAAVVESALTLTAIPADLLALLNPLQTSCTPGCGTGLPDIHFVVQDGADKRSFDSSAYSLCPDAAATHPIIRFADLRSLSLKVEALVAVCDSDSGAASSEAGSCTEAQGDAGGD